MLTPVADALNRGLVPVLHGDAVYDDDQGCAIVSGDALMVRLCDALQPELCVFLTDVAGVYDRPPSEPGAVLLEELFVSRNGELVENLATSTSAHDVTGGIRAKLEAACRIAADGTPVVIVQAATEHAERALAGRRPRVATLIRERAARDGLRTIESSTPFDAAHTLTTPPWSALHRAPSERRAIDDLRDEEVAERVHAEAAVERLDLDLLLRRVHRARLAHERFVLEHLGAAHQPAEHLAVAHAEGHPVGVVDAGAAADGADAAAADVGRVEAEPLERGAAVALEPIRTEPSLYVSMSARPYGFQSVRQKAGTLSASTRRATSARVARSGLISLEAVTTTDGSRCVSKWSSTRRRKTESFRRSAPPRPSSSRARRRRTASMKTARAAGPGRARHREKRRALRRPSMARPRPAMPYANRHQRIGRARFTETAPSLRRQPVSAGAAGPFGTEQKVRQQRQPPEVVQGSARDARRGRRSPPSARSRAPVAGGATAHVIEEFETRSARDSDRAAEHACFV